MFTDILHDHIKEAKIDLTSFVQKVQEYSSLDHALADLPEEYMEFFFNNEKSLSKPLKRLNLLESAEGANYLGMSRPDEVIRKKIKYKGEIIIIEWDNTAQVWVPHVAKRSIVQALRYGKELIDSSI